ncbi:glycosyltransferase [Thaumasiovibrio subtropicus]|uniref:glycosyltransferase n=1 Tax=Thaumasiovibrio subtropicus TaxID=1891207 RepID=UPI000B35A618|nr:glycosyltransferase [Thaumasiovibrio subtropicus]
MNILLYIRATLPVTNYGGTERVVWDLAQALHNLNHQVTLLAGVGTKSDFARVIEYDPALPFDQQVPDDIDVVHFHSAFEPTRKPYVLTQHGNSDGPIDPNTIFVSSQHAQNHGASAFVHNGLNWDNYVRPDLSARRERMHFLGKAAWRVKNVQGAIDITRKAKVGLDVMGGHRLNFKMGFRFTLDRHVRFWGMVDDKVKARVMSQSAGLVFPVTWHEPFGLAITESLYFGCPVFATPYGSLPELVTRDVGVLSANEAELVTAVSDAAQFDTQRCHDYARDVFDAMTMAKAYAGYYEQVANGKPLHQDLGAIITDFKRLPYQR